MRPAVDAARPARTPCATLNAMGRARKATRTATVPVSRLVPTLTPGAGVVTPNPSTATLNAVLSHALNCATTLGDAFAYVRAWLLERIQVFSIAKISDERK